MLEAAIFVIVLQQVNLKANAAEHVAERLIGVKNFMIVGARPGSARSNHFPIFGRRMIGIGNCDSEASTRFEILKALGRRLAAVGRRKVLPNVFGEYGIEAMLAECSLPIGVV